MAEQLIRRACDRFRSQLTADEVQQIQSVQNLDDVKLALCQVERQLAARQALRNFDRLAPFIDATEHYAKAVEVACNGTPFMPWIWVCATCEYACYDVEQVKVHTGAPWSS
ncbi:hypothetical protein MN608_10853 [Microdochium nivale]|nr:hypothetical protein MN608_10853 [Microdochium nivale]